MLSGEWDVLVVYDYSLNTIIIFKSMKYSCTYETVISNYYLCNAIFTYTNTAHRAQTTPTTSHSPARLTNPFRQSLLRVKSSQGKTNSEPLHKPIFIDNFAFLAPRTNCITP